MLKVNTEQFPSSLCSGLQRISHSMAYVHCAERSSAFRAGRLQRCMQMRAVVLCNTPVHDTEDCDMGTAPYRHSTSIIVTLNHLLNTNTRSVLSQHTPNVKGELLSPDYVLTLLHLRAGLSSPGSASGRCFLASAFTSHAIPSPIHSISTKQCNTVTNSLNLHQTVQYRHQFTQSPPNGQRHTAIKRHYSENYANHMHATTKIQKRKRQFGKSRWNVN